MEPKELVEEEELVALQRACFGEQQAQAQGQGGPSSTACRELGDLLARYRGRQVGEARAAWKRGCSRDGDAGSCWRVALLHHTPTGGPAPVQASSSSSSSDPSSLDSKSLRRPPSSPSAPADASEADNEDEDEDEGEVDSKREAHKHQQAPLPNDKKAVKYAKRACTDDAGAEGEACVAAGWLTGDREWWKRGCSKAKYLPACVLFTRERTGRLQSACEQDDDASSCYNLGVLSMTGMMDGERNVTRAADFLRRACTKGHADACYNLAQLYRKQMIGNGRENARESAYYFSLACEAGSSDGCFNLGYLFQHGIGCPRDEPLAIKARASPLPNRWHWQSLTIAAPQVYHRACTAADKPVLDACFNLGVMTKQVSYFKRACDSGMEEACRYANPEVVASDKAAADDDDKAPQGGVQGHHQQNEKGRESSQT